VYGTDEERSDVCRDGSQCSLMAAQAARWGCGGASAASNARRRGGRHKFAPFDFRHLHYDDE